MNTILLADDHQVLREALRLLLEMQPDFRVLGETGDGLEVLNLVETLKPDILIADIMMPGLSGLEVARRTKRISSSTKVIVLSMYETEGYVIEALQAGAAGYVLKKSSSSELILAIRQILAGNLYLSPSLNERVIQSYLQRSPDIKSDDPYETLTLRESEVFHLAAEGFNNPQIAERLSLSVRTIEMHRSNLMKKLGLASQTDLVKYAIKRGITE